MHYICKACDVDQNVSLIVHLCGNTFISHLHLYGFCFLVALAKKSNYIRPSLEFVVQL